MLPSWVSSWCYQQMLDQTGKFLQGANTLAYYSVELVTAKKSYSTGPQTSKLKLLWCYDSQHDDTQHNDTQHKGLICDTQQK